MLVEEPITHVLNINLYNKIFICVKDKYILTNVECRQFNLLKIKANI